MLKDDVKISQEIYASALSDARNNILTILEHIGSALDLSGFKEEENNLENLSLLKKHVDKGTIEGRQLAERLLLKHFPLVFAASSPYHNPPENAKKDEARKSKKNVIPNFSNYYSILNRCFHVLDPLRNHFCHAGATKKSKIDKRVHKGLKSDLHRIYDTALRTTATRFQLSLENELCPLLRQSSLKKNEKPVLKDNILKIFNDFPKDEESIGFESVFTEFTLVFLISLFVEPAQLKPLYEAFVNNYGDERIDNKPFSEISKWLYECLKIFRAKVPNNRIVQDDPIAQLTLDSIQELVRSPRNLYELFSHDDKEQLRISLEETEDEDFGEEIAYIRGYEDRSNELIIGHLDNSNLLGNIRFAINLGYFFYDVRIKPRTLFPDNKARIRRIGQSVITYQKLNTLQKNKPNDWQELIESHPNLNADEINNVDDVQRLSSYLVDRYPRYEYNEFGIGVKIIDPKKGKNGYPYFNSLLDNHTSPKKIQQTTFTAEFWLSPKHISELALYVWFKRLKNKSNSDYPNPEKLFTDYKKAFETILNKLSEGKPPFNEQYKPKHENDKRYENFINDCLAEMCSDYVVTIQLHQLPKAIRQQLLSQYIEPQKIGVLAKNRVEALLTDGQNRMNRLNRILTDRRKPGKRKYMALRSGEIAEFLVHDILRFQLINENKKNSDGGKLNSQGYQLLQATLAYYGKHVDSTPNIEDIFKHLGLIYGQFPHLFLANIYKNKNNLSQISDFYAAYLTERNTFLENYKKNHLQAVLTGRQKPAFWLRLKNPTPDFDYWLSDKKRRKTCILPNDFFHPFLQEILMENIADRDTTININEHWKHGILWLLRQYCEKFNIGYQAFYDWSRGYSLFRENNKLKYDHLDERKSKLQDKIGELDQLQPKSKDFEKLQTQIRQYKHNERRILHRLSIDQTLFLLARDSIQNLIGCDDGTDVSELSLRQIDPQFLGNEVPASYSISDSNNREVRIYAEKIKLRRILYLRKLALDKRVPSLLSFYEKNCVNYLEIDKQLKSYSAQRINAFQQILKLEQFVLDSIISSHCEQAPAVPNDEYSSFGEGQHGTILYSLYFKLQQNKLVTETEKEYFEQCRHIRNDFSHNRFPTRLTLNELSVNEDELRNSSESLPLIGDLMVHFLEHHYNKWMTLSRKYEGH